jgi:hypothetical protein
VVSNDLGNDGGSRWQTKVGDNVGDDMGNDVGDGDDVGRLRTTNDILLNITYVDRSKNSSRADVQPPWADLPQSALGSAESQHPPKCGTQKGYIAYGIH